MINRFNFIKTDGDQIFFYWDGVLPEGMKKGEIYDPNDVPFFWPHLKGHTRYSTRQGCFTLKFSKQNLKRIHAQFGKVPIERGMEFVNDLKTSQAQIYDIAQKVIKVKELPREVLPNPQWKMPPIGEYQHRGVVFLSNNPMAALFADCGMGKCATSTSQVLTSHGHVSLGEIWDFEGVINQVSDGEVKTLKKALMVPSMNNKGKIVWVKTNQIYREKIRKGTPLKKIKTSKTLERVVTIPHKFFINRSWNDVVNQGDAISLAGFIPPIEKYNLDNKLVLLFSWILADAHDSGLGVISITSHNSVRRLELISLCESVGVNARESSSCEKDVRVDVNDIRKVFKSWGYGTDKKLSKDKYIPYKILQSSLENKRVFLGFYLSKEGSVCNGVLQVTSASKKTILDLSMMLLQFGITSLIKTRQQCATNGTRIKRAYWYLELMGDELRKLHKEIRLYHKEKESLVEVACSRGSNPNRNLLPARDLALSLHKKLNQTEFKTFGHRSYFGCRVGGVSRKTFERLKEMYPKEPEVLEMEKLVESDLYFDVVVKSEIIKSEGEYVYDLMIPKTHNYIVDGAVSHNTYMVLNSIEHHKRLGIVPDGKTLITVKLATIETGWLEDAVKFTGLKLVDLWVSPKNKKRKQIILERMKEPADAYVINHEGIRLFEKDLTAMNFKKIVIDESTILKNHRSSGKSGTAFGKAIMNVAHQCVWRVIMSGTPASNGPADLWGQFNFLDPKGLILEPHFFDFQTQHFDVVDIRPKHKRVNADGHPIPLKPRDPKLHVPNKDAIKNIHDLTAAFTFRVRMKDHLHDMPELTIVQRIVDMGEEQEKHYRMMEKELKVMINEERIIATILITQLMKLRQITSGFIIDHNQNPHLIEDGAKVAELDSIVEDEIAPDLKVVIYAQYQYEIKMIEARYKKHGIVSVYGGNNSDKNLANIKKFREDPKVRIIVLHPKSAAHGITFTMAHHLIFYSFDHSAEDNYQCVHRIKRNGQKHPMFVYYIKCKNTIDELIYKCIVKKNLNQEELIDGTMSQGTAAENNLLIKEFMEAS